MASTTDVDAAHALGKKRKLEEQEEAVKTGPSVAGEPLEAKEKASGIADSSAKASASKDEANVSSEQTSSHSPSKKQKPGDAKAPGDPGKGDERHPTQVAPFSGGFGGLASKGGNSFSFGGTATFGQGSFGSGAAFGSSTAEVPGGGKLSEGAGDGFPSRLFGAGAGGSGEATVQVFGGNSSAAGQDKEAQAKPVTGEEDDETVFSCKAFLYFFDATGDKPGWKERGVGTVRINVQPNGKARLIMRQAGILRLLLNAWLFPEMQLHRMEGRPRVSFMCVNAAAAALEEAEGDSAADKRTEEGPQMRTYALKMGSMEKLDQFVALVDTHKTLQPQSDAVTQAPCAAVDAIASGI